MALHTKKEFAEMCGLTTGNLSVYKDRGKVVYSGDYVDGSIDLNSSFLKMRNEKLGAGKTAPADPEPVQKQVKSEVKKPERPAPKVPNTQPAEENNTIYDLNAQKIETQITKMKLEMEKLKLQNAKFMGEVIPTSLIKPSILQHNQSILTQSKIAIDNLKRIIIKKFNVPATAAADFETDVIRELNEMMKKATNQTVRSINSITNEFAAKRSAGERG